MSSGKKTLVEEGTEFKGSLASNCPIEVKGVIEGQVSAPSLTVSTSGAVRGKVKVAELRSEGELAGEFDADTVELSGSVKDNTVIRAKSLSVKLSPANGKMQMIFGECELDIGNDVKETKASASPAQEKSEKKEKKEKEKDRETKHEGNGSIPPGPMGG